MNNRNRSRMWLSYQKLEQGPNQINQRGKEILNKITDSQAGRIRECHDKLCYPTLEVPSSSHNQGRADCAHRITNALLP